MTFTLEQPGAHSAEILEFLLLLPGNSLIGHRGLVSTSIVYRGTLADCTVLLVAVLVAIVVMVGTGRYCSFFQLYPVSPVFTLWHLDIMDWDATAWTVVSSLVKMYNIQLVILIVFMM